MNYKINCQLFIFLIVLCQTYKLKSYPNLNSYIIQFSQTSKAIKKKASLVIHDRYANQIVFFYKETLSESLNLHLFECSSTLSENQLDYVKNKKNIKNIVSNLKMEDRNRPNDSYFSDQSNLLSTNIPEFWDISTGGKTAFGDKITIAIFEKGFNAEHEDLKDNIYVNRREIPYNNIDDDGNGFVDDYIGYNVHDHSASLSPNTAFNIDHGNIVSGIIGAKGNNSIGISGVNWKVKLLLVAGIYTLSDLIKGFEYVYSQRKKYNDTNGKEGIYIIASNTSFGSSSLRWPKEAPFWCEYYARLGSVGILNVAATINTPIDISQTGDIPSTCPSDYLIITTNYDIKNKILRGARSKKYVDIAAPAESVFSTGFKSYDYKIGSGTSYATSIISGSIGLLYSSPCSKLLNLKSPSERALIIKKLLLESSQLLPQKTQPLSSKGLLNLHYAKTFIQKLCNTTTSSIQIRYNTYQLTIQSKNIGHHQVQVFNQLGQLVHIFEMPITTLDSFQIDYPNNFPTGLYLFKIIFKKQVTTKKVFIY